ncbi:MscS family inner membrane protein YnaI [Shigella sonnei]|nr:MscS family inner membrane protein YnaI [Shigella sonnei]
MIAELFTNNALNPVQFLIYTIIISAVGSIIKVMTPTY